jgi:hypothetical protein
MEQMIAAYLSSLELGEAQHHTNMTVFPLFTSVNHGPEYLTMKEALDQRLLTITEVSQGGSVPELMAVNKAHMPVLLLDGEELTGAKQNRVLNTTILLKEHSETIITVSCTEQGRWAYRSPEFEDSGIIMARNIRRKKARGVHENLRTSHEYRSNQGEVWNDIATMSGEAKVSSSTHAMKDVYESRDDTLDQYLAAFPHLPCQKGILVFINGKPAGLDIVSRESACATLGPKLVKSYAIDAHLEQKGAKETKETKAPSLDKAKAFIASALTCKEEKYPSIGYGFDYRYEGPSVVGSALVSHETVIHAAFFAAEESDKVGPMAGFRQRRGHRL